MTLGTWYLVKQFSVQFSILLPSSRAIFDPEKSGIFVIAYVSPPGLLMPSLLSVIS